MSAPPPPEADWAWFFDLDGTLTDIAPTPEAVVMEASTRQMLLALRERASGAVAIVSGRALANLDALLDGAVAAVAGQHGNERRGSDGFLHRHTSRSWALDRIAGALRAFASAHPGIIVEDKGLAIAVHYRLAPQLEDQVSALMRSLHQRIAGDLLIQGGSCVFEIVPVGRHKGDAVTEFMREKPFAGRTPVFLGDDVTDEQAFMAVNQLGGHSIRVGPGDTIARYRLPDVNAVREWVQGLFRSPAAEGAG